MESKQSKPEEQQGRAGTPPTLINAPQTTLPTSTTHHVVPAVPIDRRNACNALMLSHVNRYLPTSRHHAWACAAGSKGYCATKDMLQNGIRGHTLLIESRDLRDVQESGKEECCVVYNFPNNLYVINRYKDHIPTTVTHVTIYSSIIFLPQHLLVGVTAITSIDLSPLQLVKEEQSGFLMGCTGLKSLDLKPLSEVTEVQMEFLAGCSGLSAVDLSPLSNVLRVQGGFLGGCTGLTTLDLSPLSHVTIVKQYFLVGCTGLKTLDLSPLSQLTTIRFGFLSLCSGLTTLDLGPLSRVTSIETSFLPQCPLVTSVDNPPPKCPTPNRWIHNKDTSQWVRVLVA